eukprot:Gb_39908 [translate_table: standard]
MSLTLPSSSKNLDSSSSPMVALAIIRDEPLLLDDPSSGAPLPVQLQEHTWLNPTFPENENAVAAECDIVLVINAGTLGLYAMEGAV